MKKLLPFLFCCGLFACHTADRSLLSTYLNTSNLPAQSFTINPDADTTLLSTGGVRLTIAKGTFSADQPVTIEWKEALDFQSILKAGLTTQTGKDILRSGGMLYFNATEKLDLQKTIGIDVPTETIASGMQLYKGDSSEGKLDWKDPKPIENIKAFGENALGKTIFEQTCASCHKIDNDLTGPALIGFRNRGPWKDRENYYQWMHNPAAFMAKDSYTQCLKCKYGAAHPAFPSLSPAALDSIANYVDDETERLGLTGKMEISECDSCVVYRHAYDSLQFIRDSLDRINNNSISVYYHFAPAPAPVPTASVIVSQTSILEGPEMIGHLENKSDYYKIMIDAPGWYNVDALLKDWSGATDSRLIVKM